MSTWANTRRRMFYLPATGSCCQCQWCDQADRLLVVRNCRRRLPLAPEVPVDITTASVQALTAPTVQALEIASQSTVYFPLWPPVP